MDFKDLKDLRVLARDLYNDNVENFSNKTVEDVIRKDINELVTHNGEFNYHKFQDNKNLVFAIIETLLEPNATPYELPVELQPLISTQTVALGEKIELNVNDNRLFDVYDNVDGNIDIRRQRITGDRMPVPTTLMSVKIYDELKRFLVGDVDFNDLINRARLSLNAEAQRRVGALFNDIDQPINITDLNPTGTFDPEILAEIIDRIEYEYGGTAIIYGRKAVLGKVQDVVQAESTKEQFNSIGYYGSFRGTAMLKVPTKSDKLVIVPFNDTPIVNVIYEGTPLMIDTTDTGVRNDLQQEFYIHQRVGVAKSVTEGAIYEIV